MTPALTTRRPPAASLNEASSLRFAPLYRATFGVLLLAAAQLGCRSEAGTDPNAASTAAASSAPKPDATPKTLTVFAAASLKESFSDLGTTFEQSHPNLDVQFHFAGSSELVLQLEQGARADVFAAADTGHMARAEKAQLVTTSVVFAHNELTVISPSSHPPVTFEKLPDAGKIVLGSPEVPVGKYADRCLEKANKTLGGGFLERLRKKVVSREANTRLVTSKVVLGEADAAIVYVTDAAQFRDKVVTSPIPKELNVQASYPIATLERAQDKKLAGEWIAFVLSEQGRSVLEKRGFLLPPVAP